MAKPQMVFRSRFAGICGTCDTKFPIGTKVGYVTIDGTSILVEEECPETEGEGVFSESERAKARAEMCQNCFMVHAGECL